MSPIITPGGSGGGGSQPVTAVTTHVSSAQLLACGTTPIMCVAAPGANKVIVLFGFVVQFVPGTTPYATHVAPTMQYEGGGASASGLDMFNQVTKQAYRDDVKFTGAQSTVANKAIELTSDGNPTAGDGTAEVICYYAVADLT